jgi:hypothetical protein
MNWKKVSKNYKRIVYCTLALNILSAAYQFIYIRTYFAPSPTDAVLPGLKQILMFTPFISLWNFYICLQFYRKYRPTGLFVASMLLIFIISLVILFIAESTLDRGISFM